MVIFHRCSTNVHTPACHHLITAQACLVVPIIITSPHFVSQLHNTVYEKSIGQVCMWLDGQSTLGQVHHSDRGKTSLNINKDFGNQELLFELL